jgi:hypothetical protein
MKLNKNPSKKKRISIGVAIGILIIAAAVFTFYKYQSATPSTGGTYTPNKATPTTNIPKPDSTKSNGGMTQSNGSSTTTSTPPNTVKPATPVGTFVSNHHVSLSNSTEEQSTCTTTPGDQCQIIFVMDGTQKQLASQQADSNGNVEWIWNPKDFGLSTGEWTITATATSGGGTSSTNDALKFEVSP